LIAQEKIQKDFERRSNMAIKRQGFQRGAQAAVVTIVSMIWLALGSSATFAMGPASERFSGVWDGQPYEFWLRHPSANITEVHGTWGETRYEISADGREQSVGGIISETAIILDFESRPHHMRGWLPCGTFRLMWSEEDRAIMGDICHERLALDMPDGWQARITGISLVLQKLAESFPAPMRSTVEYYLRETLSASDLH
jgi:hypothetical protein